MDGHPVGAESLKALKDSQGFPIPESMEVATLFGFP
jgi:hypothetical protein